MKTKSSKTAEPLPAIIDRRDLEIAVVKERGWKVEAYEIAYLFPGIESPDIK